jgi:hypothetical protein
MLNFIVVAGGDILNQVREKLDQVTCVTLSVTHLLFLFTYAIKFKFIIH